MATRRPRPDQIAMNERQCARRHDQTAIRRACEGFDGASDLAWVAHVDRVYLYPEQRRHSLNDGKLGGAGSYVGIAKDCRSRHVRRDLLEQLQPFSA
jgi:hypothetical protein